MVILDVVVRKLSLVWANGLIVIHHYGVHVAAVVVIDELVRGPRGEEREVQLDSG